MKGRIFSNFVLIASIFFLACSSLPVTFPVRIEGTAMLPSFNNGDRVLMEKSIGELKRGEVIIFLYPKERNKSYIKRIVGLPGETIEIRSGKVYVSGQVLDEPYVDESFNQQKMNAPPTKIPEFHYFVMGDNRDNSSDSRYWGTVDKEVIKGKYYTTDSKAKE